MYLLIINVFKYTNIFIYILEYITRREREPIKADSFPSGRMYMLFI